MAKRVRERAPTKPTAKRSGDKPAAAGDNSAVESKGVFLEFVRRVGLKKRLLEEARGAYRSELKLAKAAGIRTKNLIASLEGRRRDPAELLAEHNQRVRYFAWIGLPIGAQAELFGAGNLGAGDDHTTDTEDLEHALWEAEEAGYRAGRSGQDRTNANSHPGGSEKHVRWDKGYLAGMAAIAAEMGPSVTKKQGRKQAGGNPEDRSREAVH